MNWDRYRSVMERYAIKTDDMATEDAYFMATHMPFAQLEVLEGGQTTAAPDYLSEEEVFEKLVYNPENLHRLIIVRGNNGTGKSHLIRYLKARLENSPSTIYDPRTEQLIFLRRLNNSVRGVFSQLLDQKVIQDPDVEEKMKKFVHSSEAMGEDELKTKLWLAYVGTVNNDKTNETYRSVECRNIAQFLSDSRVERHLMREDGAISRCYRLLTAPSDQVLKETTVFTADDFSDSKLLKAVIRAGSEEAADFATTLKEGGEQIAKLVQYLNRFTRNVVQQCADISSESTKSVFETLRRDLKRQGKNLTLFIEDFTGFTGIDTELITVLSTEHGGDYADLCRVTAIIGITDGYYGQFKDNFKDRVTHQINVTERSYGTENFLVHMAARYLNAVYCDPEEIQRWNREGAVLDELPISDFTPPCPWESESIGKKEATLYPFNRKALMALYQSLPVKTPRMFLKEVIRAQLKEYFDGKKFGDEWGFPLNPGAVSMSNAPHSSAIDRQEQFSPEDRQRLKNVFALWGDGSARGVRDADGTVYFGGLNRAFLEDIGLSQFAGVGRIETADAARESGQEPPPAPGGARPERRAPVQTGTAKAPNQSAREDAETRKYRRLREDIEAWYAADEALQYTNEYKTWLRNFLCGSGSSPGAVNWQDLGIPAYLASERLSDIGVIYIEGQSNPGNPGRALITVERTVESRDALLALVEYDHAKRWEFSDAAYYQQKLITWLERRKTGILRSVCAAGEDGEMPPVYTWCLALGYLRARILRQPVGTSSPLALAKSLFVPAPPVPDAAGGGSEGWSGLVSVVQHEQANFDAAQELLALASNTTMGAVQRARSSSVFLYHTDQLLAAAEHLLACNWDIEDELPREAENNLLFHSAALLKKLYPKIRQAMDAEERYGAELCSRLTPYLGALTQENLIETLSAIQDLFFLFLRQGIPVRRTLRDKYDALKPEEYARRVQSALAQFSEVEGKDAMTRLTVYSEHKIELAADLLRDFQEIESLAEKEERNAQRQTDESGRNTGLDACAAAAQEEMAARWEQLSAMEVNDAD